MMETSATRQTYCLLVVTSSLKQILEAVHLNTTSIAHEAGVPSMTLWRTMRGMPVTPQATECAILRVTRICVVGSGRR